jgi:nicotinamide riboside kinase
MHNLQLKKVICLYGGPGSGKSTTQALLFGTLKNMGANCEMIREYIKDWCWEARKVRAGDQTYFFAKQSRKERVLIEQGLDFIISDSPLILNHFYGLKYDWLEQECHSSKTLLEHHHYFTNMMGYKIEHFIIKRSKQYNPNGRYQTEQEAKQFDKEIQDLLDRLNIKYHIVDSVDQIINLLPKVNV